MLAIRSVNVMSHFTEWTIGHVHSGALGWNALITFGTLLLLGAEARRPAAPQRRDGEPHFWLALAGILLYIISMWGAGLSQSLLWLSLDDLGEVRYSFVDVSRAMAPVLHAAARRRRSCSCPAPCSWPRTCAVRSLGTRTVTVEPPVACDTPPLAPAQRVAMSPVNAP